MNCREINHTLDSKAPDALTPAQRESIEAHFAACRTCAEEWASWREIAELPIPAAPPGIADRIAAALPAQDATTPRRQQRVWIVGGCLGAGLAVAAGMSLWLGKDALDRDAVPAGLSQEPVPASAVTETSRTVADATLADGGSETGRSDVPEGAGSQSSDIALDPLSIAVFPRPEPAAGVFESAELTNCHDAIVRELRAIGGLNVIAGASVASFDDSGLSDPQIAGQLGAGNRLLVSTSNGCNARLSHTQTDERLAGSTYAGADMPPVDGWEGFARGFAMSVRDALLGDPATLLVEARTTLLNTALDDYRRIGALRDLRSGGSPPGAAVDSTVIMVAAQIGMNSASVDARLSAWVGLRGIDDSYLIEPLLQSLAGDPDETVRMQAAISLNTFLDAPGVKDALLLSAAADPSSDPEFPCCIPTVREAAAWAAQSTAELPDWARGILLDESLPARSRLAPVTLGYPDGRQLLMSQLGDDAPGIVFDIGRNAQDPRVRRMAWGLLAQSPRDDAFVSIMLDDLSSHPYEYVRSSAAAVLWKHVDDPDVRAALEAALDDPSMAVRRNAMMGLERE